jgi:PAS domain S-box-containing protein
MLDISGTILEMNPAGLAMIEADRADQVIGQCAYPIVALEYRAAFQEFNERVCRGEPGSMQYDIIGLKSTRRRLATKATPLRDGSGLVAQLAVTHDITEAKRAEEALRQSEELFRGIFEGTSAGITLTDASGRFVSCNPAFAAIVGRTVNELLLLSPEDLTHPDDWSAHKPLFDECRSGRRNRYEVSKRYLLPDGSVVWTELSFTAIRGCDGEYQYGLGVSIDTTIRRQLEDQLQEARKLEAIGRLAGGIAHDFNNLLTGVIGNLSLIQLPANDPSRANLGSDAQAARLRPPQPASSHCHRSPLGVRGGHQDGSPHCGFPDSHCTRHFAGLWFASGRPDSAESSTARSLLECL